MLSEPETHVVFNQPPPFEGQNLFTSDRILVEAVGREGAPWAVPDLTALGARAGEQGTWELGRLANEHRPELRSFDRFGHRVDVVEYHPAYHELMRTAVAAGLHAAPWADRRKGAHVARAAKVLVWYQVEAGHLCPISMTYSVVPALRHAPDLAAEWEPRLTSSTYDPADAPGEGKAGVTCGMALTEKQGGSDVRANTTTAEPDPVEPGAYRLTGHKWFCSAPMSDGFLLLAQTAAGLGCFWVPRWCPDGSRNPVRIQRLKDKLGDRSNASSEIELAGVWGRLVGEEGRGVPTIIEMINRTRLDCVLGATALMRQALAQATWHAAHRSTFGRRLVEQPLMTNILADLALESVGATLAAVRLARAYDSAGTDEHERLAQRLLTPVVKFWTCKRAPQHLAEALECLGGNGYVEESPMPRLFRQGPVNGLWEGSGNVICLDVLRAMLREPASVDAYLAEVGLASGADPRFDEALTRLRRTLSDSSPLERRARQVVQRMAVLLEASLVLRHAPPALGDAFCASRLEDGVDAVFGTLPGSVDAASVLRSSVPWAA